ncbi:MAG: heavy metal translocating P-type ATPase [Deltaproteobacteria bacterium]|nr:MAG: heavy metal translocating P-type ATPase [Deltaproteobacteria bacterium]
MKKRLSIRHEIPTRIRFHVNAAKRNPAYAKDLAEKTACMPGVVSANAKSVSGSLVVRFDPMILGRDGLISAVMGFVQPEGAADTPVLTETEQPVRSALVQFLGLTAVMGAVFVKEVVLGMTVAQGLLSPVGVIVAVASLPMLKKGLMDFKERRFTLDAFLGGSIVLAAAAGEALAALEILWITAGSHLLQAWITERSRASIRNILQITAKNTFILIDGVEVEVPVSDVHPGDVVVLHTGEKVSVDGEIVDGEAIVDESPINGRSEPAMRKIGDTVFAGTFIRQGVIFVSAKKVGDRTYLSRILRMVEDSLENRAPVEGVAEKLAANLIKVGFVTTAGTYLITGSLWRAFTVLLVMACPCATILSASTAVSAALSAAARRHILIKGGRYLEAVGQADVVCFDKTGTLTTNQPEIRQVVNVSTLSDDDFLQLIYSVEAHNFHPVALAVKREAERRDIEPLVHDTCEYLLGRGVRAQLSGSEIIVGNAKMMDRFEVDTRGVAEDVAGMEHQGLTLVYVAKDGVLLGLVGFANQDRPNVKTVVRHLIDDGVKRVAMITGDGECSASHLAQKLNIDACFASVMPEEKAGYITDLRNDGSQILMVGDGINDALALAEADIGIAMGAGGSEVAIEAADIALVRDDLTGILYVRSLSKETLRIVHQNFWIATGSNLAGVVLGAMGLLSPVMAGLVHITHTVGILANSSRLLAYHGPALPEKDPEEDHRPAYAPSTVETLDS